MPDASPVADQNRCRTQQRLCPIKGPMEISPAFRRHGRCNAYGLFVLAIGLIGCAESFKHDEVLAGKRAAEFAQVAFVKQDFDNGYALLSDAAKRYVSREKFKETVSRLHPRTNPKSVTATEYEPMPGEKAIYIFLMGENAGERFHYRLTMEGSAETGYKVSRLTRGEFPYSSRTKIGSPRTQS
jgi:hypothetical protein